MISNSGISTKSTFKKIIGNGDVFNGEIKYHHILAQLMCNPPRMECWLGDCRECEDVSHLTEALEEGFKALDIEKVTYK